MGAEIMVNGDVALDFFWRVIRLIEFIVSRCKQMLPLGRDVVVAVGVCGMQIVETAQRYTCKSVCPGTGHSHQDGPYLFSPALVKSWSLNAII